ncbi:DUF1223 domain-containing protein [Rhodobacteraceae bacterium CCMM004]|nr:DUF1223 domain-containing protein [Rhodobacteraceae bacterium CCMM004]
MRIIRTVAAAFAVALWAAVPAAAQDKPVVVELFTSQGCSSCPPADALLASLADRDDVIALALHVDYWDYIGWKDRFGSPVHTARQKGYARAARQRTVYTPQMIVGGVDHVVGYKPMRVADLIQKHKAAAAPVDLYLRRDGATLRIDAMAVAEVPKRMMIHLVRLMPHAKVEITHGENAGKTLTYSNIVTQWRQIARWDGDAAFTMTLEVRGPLAVLVQAPGHGPILAAAKAH